MKIAFVLPGSGASGGNRCTVAAGNGLAKRGHEVRLLVHKPNTFSRAGLRSRWLRICYPGTHDWLSLFKGQVETFRDLPRCSFECGEMVIGVGLWSCREVSKLPADHVKRVHYVHGEIPWDINFMREAWDQNITKIAVASFLRQRVKDVCGQDVFAVTPNGVDTTQYYPTVPDSQRNGVGTIFENAPHKDPAMVTHLLRKLRVAFPTVEQRVFGTSRRPKEIPRSIYVRFPSIETARDIYSRSLVWILASRSEGFGLPILEAMACGCAVVATDCGGPRDIIKDRENGFLVEIGNVDDIVHKVRLLLENEDLRRRIVERGMETAKRFSWDASISKLEGVLKEIDSLDC
jgi:glycosyltransferase involved in cell wall biosynthesis